MKYLFLVATALIITGCSQNTQVTTTLDDSVIQSCSSLCTINNSECIDDCWLYYAIDNSNPVACSKISMDELQTTCAIDMANVLNKPEHCIHAADEDFCLYTIALSLKSMALCESIESEVSKAQCKKVLRRQ